MTKDADASPGRVSAEQRIGLDYVRECFDVRDSVVYWRDRPLRHFADEHAWKVFQSKYAGKPAGRKEANGYVTINMRYFGQRIQFQAHRVVWMLHQGRWPALHLDHINRVRDDNRLENLREVTVAENNNNSAAKRVHPYVWAGRCGGFQAQTKIGGEKAIYLGIFDTEQEACAYRDMVNAELEKLARSLAKKSKTGRKTKGHQTPSPEGSAPVQPCRTEQECTQPEVCRYTHGCERVEDAEEWRLERAQPAGAGVPTSPSQEDAPQEPK